jgi:hypothetical protein
MTAWQCRSCGTYNGDQSAMCVQCGAPGPVGPGVAGPGVVGSAPVGPGPVDTLGPVEPPRRLKLWVPVVTGVVGLIALLVTAALILPESPFRLSALDGRTKGPGGPSSAPSSAPSGQAQPSGTRTGTPRTSAPATTASPAKATGPVTVGLVTIDPSVTDQRAAGVATMFNTHFTGINNKDYARAIQVFDPAGVLNPNDPDDLAQFQQGVSTTHDRDVLLRAVGPPTTGKGTLEARLSFNSEQQAGYGPKERKNETCTHWDIWYVLTEPSSGQYRILGSRPTNSAC